ncbi:MAG: HAD domain-containing protein [Kofleriaceae bacterium]
MRVLFLDVDGVLNRTGYHPGASVGLRSWIEPELATRLSEVLCITGAQIVLSSDWRIGREPHHLQHELTAAGIAGTLLGVTPALDGAPRWRQIQAWMDENDVRPEDVVIVDDGYDMGPLAPRFVRASPLNGLDKRSADAIVALFASHVSE